MKIIISIVLILIINSVSAQIPTSGLRALYQFSSNTLDSSGLNNHAVAGGCSFVDDRFGNPNAALAFNGISDSLVMPVDSFTPIIGDFSISFWIKTSSPEKMNMFSIKQFADDTTDNFEMQLTSISALQTVLEMNYSSFTYWNGSGWNGNNLSEGAHGKYYNGKWHHFVLQRSNDTIQLWHNRDYLNYEPYNNYYAGVLGDASDLVMSALPYRFKGTVDDIAIYNRCVTEKEIMQLYHDHKPFEFASPLSTDAYVQGDTAYVLWKFDSTALSDSVNLEYRLNETGNWMLTTQNELVDWTPFYFPLNYPVGTKIEMRITDKADSTKRISTGVFRISEYEWESVSTSLPFTPRDGSGLLNFNGKMWLIGGWDPPYDSITNYTMNEIWNTTDGINWIQEPDAPWLGRHCSGWLVHDNAMWVIGGDPQSGFLRDVWKSIDGINWIEVLDTIPNFSPLRSMHMTASLNGYMLNFGGQQIQYVNENLSQVWRSADGVNWEQLPDAPWGGRGAVINSCVDDNDTLWLLGGGRLNDRRCFNDVWKTGDGINWELVNPAAPWQSRYWHTVAWFDNKMWVLCGISNQTNNAETWYSKNGIDWYELKNPKYMDRHAASTTVYDNSLWLMTGIISNDAWRLRNTTFTSVEETVFTEPQILVYPNPATSQLRIRSSNQMISSVIIYDLLGKEILKRENIFSANCSLNIAHFNAGIYLVKIKTEEGEVVRTVVKN